MSVSNTENTLNDKITSTGAFQTRLEDKTNFVSNSPITDQFLVKLSNNQNVNKINFLTCGQNLTLLNASSSKYLSEIERAILRSPSPIKINKSNEVTVLGRKGIWINKNEINNLKGSIPLEKYLINHDPNPEIITKKNDKLISYIQEMSIRYLRPKTPPEPGEIIIQQQPDAMISPAPPLIIRQKRTRISTPEPIFIREAPPIPPKQVERKVITICGKRLPPPPRKVLIERLALLPSKLQSIIVERWLPYSDVKRRVIYQRPIQSTQVSVNPKNVIIQWKSPHVQVRKDLKFLGIINANPAEYVNRYGDTLKLSNELPDFVLDIKPPQGITLAADCPSNQVHILEGAVHALKLIDLEREGLSEYKSQVERLNGANEQIRWSQFKLITKIFNEVDRDQHGSLSIEEAHKLILKFSNQLGRKYDDEYVGSFLKFLNKNDNGSISLKELRKSFEKLIFN